MDDCLNRVGFLDRAGSVALLETLFPARDVHAAEILGHALFETADPDLVIVRMARFLESHPEPESERRQILSDIRYARLLCTIVDQSHFLTDILCRFPEHLARLTTQGALDREWTADELARELRRWTADCRSLDACGEAMRRFRHREILRIAARDIFMHAPLQSITADLSNFADAALEVAIEYAMPMLERRYGTPLSRHTDTNRPATFSVIGLGKLGGRELNFSSDIDLLFLYSEDAETTGGTSGTAGALDYFHKLGELIIKLLAQPMTEGRVFRIDMRLRPYGCSSPLAISVPQALDYYARYAQAWERQALIKARHAAGAPEPARDFIERTRSLVFPRYFDDDTLDAIRQMKLQMEQHIAGRGETEIEVKLGRGGIRDIEFTVQMLQMLNGGRMPDLRATGTLDAIQSLGLHGHLTAFDAATLTRNYIFMRQIEHRLQIEGGRQRHALPTDPAALDRFARRLGYRSAQSFLLDYREHAEQTRQILDKFLSAEGAGALWTYDLLSLHAEGADALARLARMGFKNPEQARRELIQLNAGPENQPYPFHVRRAFAAIVPNLLQEISATHDPDGILVRLARILSNLRAPAAIYGTLDTHPFFCRHLVALVANSRYLSEMLVRDPGLFEILETESDAAEPPSREALENELESLARAYESEAAPYRFRDAAVLRVAVRELFHEASGRDTRNVVDVCRELTDVADVCLEYVVKRARQDVVARYDCRGGDFAVLGLGKLGGREMSYGSDLDLVFVYDGAAAPEGAVEPAEYAAAVAARVVQRLREPTPYGSLYDIDARLRPDGRKGVLAVTSRRLREYYLEEAQPWERMALMKARAVAGNEPFAREIEATAREMAFALPLTPENLAQIDEIRSRLVLRASPLELKRTEGGLIELEFAVRLLQLRHVAAAPDLRRADTFGALDVLGYGQLIPSATYHALRDSYLFLRRLENRIRMMHGRSESTLPEDKDERDELARRLGLRQDPAALLQFHKSRVHRLYLNVLDQLGAAPGPHSE